MKFIDSNKDYLQINTVIEYSKEKTYAEILTDYPIFTTSINHFKHPVALIDNEGKILYVNET